MHEQAPRIVISGGGSGGHLFPALAIADEIQRAYPSAELQFVGARGKIEMEKVPLRGYPITGLWISGYQRGLVGANLSLPAKVLSSLWKAWHLLRRFRPHAVVGVGGFASLPVGWMAERMGLPLIIQEQNAFPGLVNRMLGPKAGLICAGFPGLEQYFQEAKIKVTGNPVRADLLNPTRQSFQAVAQFGLSPKAPVILVLGGSAGARSINEGVLAALPQWLEYGAQLIWQTGKLYFEEMKARIPDSVEVNKLFLAPFLDDMPSAYAAAKVVISRAGAISLSELACQGRAAILVPSPNVADDHQAKNARQLAGQEAAMVVEDHDARTYLGNAVLELLKNNEHRIKLEKNISGFAKPNATARIVALLFQHIQYRQTRSV